MRAIDANAFLKDVRDHRMTIKQDDGVYRHLIFRASTDSWNQWFEIVTWPGMLTIHGDMGTWSFARVEDMFGFFRSSDSLKINADYWREKIESESRFGGPSKRFDHDAFHRNVIDSLPGYNLTEKEHAEVIEALKDVVFREQEEYSVRRALVSFEHRLSTGSSFGFSDAWEISGDEFSFHYLWCLYAIVWGIQQYDVLSIARTSESPKTEIPEKSANKKNRSRPSST
jgi:hypothetical protein